MKVKSVRVQYQQKLTQFGFMPWALGVNVESVGDISLPGANEVCAHEDERQHPANTQRNKHVIFTSKRRYNYMFIKWCACWACTICDK